MRTTKIKEHPINFTADSVRAIDDLRKTQTRRVVKPQPTFDYLAEANRGRKYGCLNTGESTGWVAYPGEPGVLHNQITGDKIACPYGVPGDRLYWANEPIEIQRVWGDQVAIKSLFDGKCRTCELPERVKRPSPGRYRGRRMPREWARFFWPLTDVRMERLQEISEADARAEGADGGCLECGVPDGKCVCASGATPSYRDGFARIWDDLNAKRGFPWESNPWVWRLSFRRADP